LEYFVLSEGPLTINPHPFGSLGPHLTYKPHLYYKKSREAGERDIVRLNQRRSINEENWIYADGLWFEVGIHESPGSTEIDPNIAQYLFTHLPRSTKNISIYHNHPYWLYDKSKPNLERDVASIAECPALMDLKAAEERITDVKSRFFFANVDSRIVTPTGVYIIKLNENYYRTRPYHYIQNMKLIKELITWKKEFPFALRPKLELDKNAGIVEENQAFCRYLNEHQKAWEFNFIPISP